MKQKQRSLLLLGSDPIERAHHIVAFTGAGISTDSGVPDFRGLWCLTIGPKSAWVIDLCIAQMCLSACIIYSGIIGLPVGCG